MGEVLEILGVHFASQTGTQVVVLFLGDHSLLGFHFGSQRNHAPIRGAASCSVKGGKSPVHMGEINRYLRRLCLLSVEEGMGWDVLALKCPSCSVLCSYPCKISLNCAQPCKGIELCLLQSANHISVIQQTADNHNRVTDQIVGKPGHLQDQGSSSSLPFWTWSFSAAFAGLMDFCWSGLLEKGQLMWQRVCVQWTFENQMSGQQMCWWLELGKKTCSPHIHLSDFLALLPQKTPPSQTCSTK